MIQHNIDFKCRNCGGCMYLQDIHEGPEAIVVLNVNRSDYHSYNDDAVPLAVAAAAAGQTVTCSECGAFGTVAALSPTVEMYVRDMGYHVDPDWVGAVPGIVHQGDCVMLPMGIVGMLAKVEKNLAYVQLAVGEWIGPLNKIGMAPVKGTDDKEPAPAPTKGKKKP